MLLAKFCQEKQIFKTLIIFFQQEKLHILKIPPKWVCFKMWPWHIMSFIIFLWSYIQKDVGNIISSCAAKAVYFSPLTFKETLTFSFCPYTMQVSWDADQTCTSTLGFCSGTRLERFPLTDLCMAASFSWERSRGRTSQRSNSQGDKAFLLAECCLEFVEGVFLSDWRCCQGLHFTCERCLGS